MFIADSPGLDFLNSVATPGDVPIDWIDDGMGLLAWLAQAQLVPAQVLGAMRKRAMPGELDRLRGSGAQPAGMVQDLRAWAPGPAARRRRSG